MFSEKMTNRIMRLTKGILQVEMPSTFRTERDVEEAIRTLNQLMRISDSEIKFDRSYEKSFEEKFFDDEDMDLFIGLIRVEGLMKKILRITNITKYEEGPGFKNYWELNELYKHFHNYDRYSSAVVNRLAKNFPDNKFHLSECNPYDLPEEKLCQHYCRVYRARNMKGHDLAEDEIELANMRRSVLIVYLDMCYRYKKQIQERYNMQKAESIFDSMSYAKKIKKGYFDKVEKYLMVKWNSVTSAASEEEVETKDLIINNPTARIMKLVGCAGIGKSESMRYLQYMQARDFVDEKNGARLPIYIPLIDYKENVTINKMIANVLGVEESDVDSIVKTFQCVLFFDGYNEIVDLVLRENAKKQIEEFIENHKNTYVILADRSVTTNPRIATQAVVYQMDTLDAEQIQEFFRKNCRKTDSKEIDKVALNKIMEKYDKDSNWLVSKTTTPLMLLTVIEMAQKSAPLPEKTSDFFRKYIEYKLVREEDEKADSRIYDLKHCLRRLSGDLLIDVDDTIREETILDAWVEKFHFIPREAKELLRLATGLGFLEVKDDAKHIGWTSQEYLDYFFDEYADTMA